MKHPDFPFFNTQSPDVTCIGGVLALINETDSEDYDAPSLSEGTPCPFCSKAEFISIEGAEKYDEIIRWVKTAHPEYPVPLEDDLLAYAESLDLSVVETVIGHAVIGFRDFAQADDFAKKTCREVVYLTRKPGARLWRTGAHAYEPLVITEDDCTEGYMLCSDMYTWWVRVMAWLEILMDENCTHDSIREYLASADKIFSELLKLPENSQVLVSPEGTYELLPIEVMRLQRDNCIIEIGVL